MPVQVEKSSFKRQDAQVTASVGYTGGNSTGPGGLVCYHGGPSLPALDRLSNKNTIVGRISLKAQDACTTVVVAGSRSGMTHIVVLEVAVEVT